MTDPKNGPYYDPASEREELRRVILLPQAFALEDQINLEKIFDALTKVRAFSEPREKFWKLFQ